MDYIFLRTKKKMKKQMRGVFDRIFNKTVLYYWYESGLW